RERHTSFSRDWSSDVCSSDLEHVELEAGNRLDDFTAHGHAAERVEDHAADRVDVLGMLAGCESAADGVGDVLDLRLGVDEEDARSEERRVGEAGRGGWCGADD